MFAHWSRVKPKVENTTSETARNEAMSLDVPQDHFFSSSSEGHPAPAVIADELSFPGLTGLILYQSSPAEGQELVEDGQGYKICKCRPQ